MQKLAVPTDSAAMIALIIVKQLVAVTVAVATIARTAVGKPRLNTMNDFLRYFLSVYQRNNFHWNEQHRNSSGHSSLFANPTPQLLSSGPFFRL